MKQEHKPAGMTLDQILYTIFRHKWKVLIISILGIAATAALPFISPIPYESEAKLYIRYVMENRMPSQSAEDTHINPLNSRSDSILNTELELLTSRDLAQQVADSIGPELILAKVGGGTNRIKAAGLIQSRLTAEIARESSVIRLTFQHPDVEIVQPVMARLVDMYFKRHVQMHALGAFDEFLTQQTDQLRTSLSDTEEALRKAKAKLGVISLEDTKKAYSELNARLEQQIVDADAELAERRAAVKELAKLAPGVATTSTNTEPATNTVSEVPAEQLARYKSACNLLEKLQKKEQELLEHFTPESTFVKDIRQQIDTAAKTKKDLELQNPGLLIVKISATTNNFVEGHITDPEVAVTAEMARVRGLESKVQVLTEQLDQLHRKAMALDDAEGSITELQRRKGLQESAFTKFSQNLEQSQIDEKLGAGKVSNISTIEEPTPPRKAKSKLFKIMAGLLVGSLGAAFGLAFLIELYLDQSMKRPAEVEAKLGLPLFLDIPRLNRSLQSFLKNGKRPLELAANKGQNGTESEESNSSGMEVVAPWHGHPLQSYYEALRDRLITYFEMKNLTHKPKLVAVTSCAEGSGVSTIASGLAASLSETGEGNVLLVNMKTKNGVAHHFHKGELACGLEEALEADKRDTALVQDNLYMVNEGQENQNVPTFLPKRFKQLLPRLRASDFDCIIFDMPPVSQISITPRLARFMDVVLMVVESGRTHVDVVKRASSMLVESNPNVGIVLNKRRDYVPRGLKQES